MAFIRSLVSHLVAYKLLNAKDTEIVQANSLYMFLFQQLFKVGINCLNKQEFSSKTSFKRRLTLSLLVATHHENMHFQIYRKFHLQKLKIFRQKLIFFIFLLKTDIVGTC